MGKLSTVSPKHQTKNCQTTQRAKNDKAKLNMMISVITYISRTEVLTNVGRPVSTDARRDEVDAARRQLC